MVGIEISVQTAQRKHRKGDYEVIIIHSEFLRTYKTSKEFPLKTYCIQMHLIILSHLWLNPHGIFFIILQKIVVNLKVINTPLYPRSLYVISSSRCFFFFVCVFCFEFWPGDIRYSILWQELTTYCNFQTQIPVECCNLLTIAVWIIVPRLDGYSWLLFSITKLDPGNDNLINPWEQLLYLRWVTVNSFSVVYWIHVSINQRLNAEMYLGVVVTQYTITISTI